MELKTLDFKDRIINLFGDIEESSVAAVIQKIVEINVNDDEYLKTMASIINIAGYGIDPANIDVPPIILNLSTYGGVCYDGLALCDVIKSSSTPIKIICSGKIMSMGIPILLSGVHKAAHKNTTFMIHGISSGWFGKNKDMQEYVEQSTKLENKIVNYILENSKFPKKKMNEIIEKKLDYYFDAEEALKYKIIDEII